MPVYLFECDGEIIERSFGVDECPTEIVEGKVYKKILAPVAIHAYTPVGEKARRAEERQYRINKQVAEGLAKGTHREPDDRDVCGDRQSRTSIAQFNDIYDHARRMK